MPQILCQASHGFPIVRFILHAIKTGEYFGVGSRATGSCGKTSDGIESDRGRVFAAVGKSDFQAIGETREENFQPRMSGCEVFENFRARSDDGGLQMSDNVVLQAGGISEPTDYTSGTSRQAGVGFDLQVESFWLSGHGC